MTRPFASSRPLRSEAPLLLALLLGGCSPSSGGATPDPGALAGYLAQNPRPNVVVYLIDTLRADRLSLYGYEKGTSPNIDRFAQESVVFEQGYVQASWTKPSVATLITGRFPSNHGAVRREHALREDVQTIAELLSAGGYSTGGVVTNPNVLPVYGFDQGFDHYLDVEHKLGRSATVHEMALALIDGGKLPEPFFLYLHTRDPHRPYSPPERFQNMFMPDKFPTGQRAAVVSLLSGLYDAEIAYNDEQLGLFLESLRERDLYDDTLILLVSDHGEEFLDHGGEGHGQTLYEEQLHVPFVMKLPGSIGGGRREGQPVRAVDVLPTLAELLGLSTPPELDGTSFLGLLSGEDTDYDPLLYAELNHDGHVISSLRKGPYKVIVQQAPRGQRGTRLYDLREPGEKNNVAEGQADIGGKLVDDINLIESALNHGTYLEICNGVALDDALELEGAIEVVDGTIVSLVLTETEVDDVFELSEDRTRVDFRVQLGNRKNPIDELPAILRDTERARFVTSPPDARLRVSLARVTAPGPPVILGTDAAGGLPLPIEVALDDERLLLDSAAHALSTPVLLDTAYLRLYSVERTEGPEIEIDDSIEKRLRALGY